MNVQIVAEDKFVSRLASKIVGTLCSKKTSKSLAELGKSDSDSIFILDLRHSDLKSTFQRLYELNVKPSLCIAYIEAGDPFKYNACIKIGMGLILHEPIDPLAVRSFIEGRLESALKKPTPEFSTERLSLGLAEIDSNSQQLFLEGKSCGLSPTEFKILSLLCVKVGDALSREIIKNRIWGKNFAIENRSIDSYISRLRQKIHDTGISIKSKKNEGYILSIH